MKIIIKSEQELIEVATQAIHVLYNLRTYTKGFDKHYGFELRNRKKYYEELADALLEKLKVQPHRQAKQIKIEIDETPQ